MVTARPTVPPPGRSPSVTDWTREAVTTTEDEFARRHPGQFLILERVGPAAAASALPRRPAVLDVLPVEKRDQNNPFTSMITIGRARNNDVVVEHESVARMHAWIRRAADTVDGTSATLTDGGSAGETSVDGSPVHAATVPLELGARIRLGQAELLYVEARRLHAILRALRAAA